MVFLFMLLFLFDCFIVVFFLKATPVSNQPNYSSSWVKIISKPSDYILQENVRLKICDISWNGFGPEGGAAVGEAMVSNNALLELDISGNRLTADTAVKMARMISSNDNIRTLRVTHNYYHYFRI